MIYIPVPMLFAVQPAIISVEEVRTEDSSPAALRKSRLCSAWIRKHGQAIISTTRQPNTPGVNGSGTLLGVGGQKRSRSAQQIFRSCR